jgi:hypothetical protein
MKSNYYMKHNRKWGYEERPTSLYVMDTTAGFKVGIASDVVKRQGEIQSHCPLPVSVVYEEEYPTKALAGSAEREMHKVLAHRNIHSEWFAH